MSEELKPCPFCRSTDPIIHHIEPHKHPISGLPDYEGGCTIECSGCDLGFIKPTEAEAVAAWNRRAQPERKLTDAELPKPDVHLAWSDDGENIRFWTRNAGHAREWENENWPTESYFSAEQMRALLASQPASDVPETNCGNMAAQPAASHSVCHDCRVSPDGAHQDHCPEAAAQPAAATVPEWQPIETAPKDQCILLGRLADEEHIAFSTLGWWIDAVDDGVDYTGHDAGFVDHAFQYFNPGRSFGSVEWQHVALQPTHWMPLPQPPAAQAQDDGEKR